MEIQLELRYFISPAYMKGLVLAVRWFKVSPWQFKKQFLLGETLNKRWMFKYVLQKGLIIHLPMILTHTRFCRRMITFMMTWPH